MNLLLIEQNLGVATAVAERQLVMVAGRIFTETTADRAARPTRSCSSASSASRGSSTQNRAVRGRGGREPMPTVVLVGTLDTKGREYAYLRDRLREHGVDVLLVDAGVLGEPLVEPDVARDEVATAAGADVAALAPPAIAAPRSRRWARRGRDRLAPPRGGPAATASPALGGSGGSSIATHAMRQPPGRRAEADGLDRRVRATRGRTSAPSTSR